MPLAFSLFLPTGFGQELASFDDPVEAAAVVTRLAETAEEAGFAAVYLPDHLQTVPPSQAYVFESWSLLTTLAARTERIRLGQLVSGNAYRNPALQAKMASTVDVLSNGRLDFGIGAGWYERDYEAFGYPYDDGPERLRRLREAVQVIRSLWTQDVTTFAGKYYRLVDAVNQPRGVQQPHIPLMIAGGGEKVTLKLVAQYADACNLMASPAEVERKLGILRAHCDAVGSDFDGIRRTVTTACLIAGTDDEAQGALAPETGLFYPGDFASYLLYGTVDTVRRRIAAYEAVGVQELVIGFHDSLNPDAIRRFAKEFIG
ncbi:Luciferase-like monooxygenase [Kribbella flavida DSM 17836]|uniref:Luciferase-like monooxygenase n=1 Tax=Kribbella flavida (strain DSM 17836 / JCM 10339 / NBRC 14399) TaxID=479435 RepID=D2Q2S3_KRIFD|nr:LLM class F420-dependent oxidoreductase [Kribbella flavida]ADB30254.1 Luciferase-like monooxygenase [Kribbella flavida DSM 17836]